MVSIADSEKTEVFPGTPVKLYLSLTKGEVKPNKFWYSRHFRFKFLVRALLMPVATYNILKMLTEHPLYPDVMLSQPRLPCRIHRPYLSTRLNNKERVGAIMHHYNMHVSLLRQADLKKHFSPEGLEMAKFTAKDNHLFYLQYISTYRLDREGEASIILRNSAGQMLSEITFTLYLRNEENALIIGGLQGPNYENAHAVITQATKDLYGIFPKRVVLEALTILAQIFNIKSIYAVSNSSHIYKSVRYKNRAKHIHADYDAFWETSGALLTYDGHYLLPCMLPRKKMDDIASKKRAEYRRRFELFDELSHQIKETFVND